MDRLTPPLASFVKNKIREFGIKDDITAKFSKVLRCTWVRIGAVSLDFKCLSTRPLHSNNSRNSAVCPA